MPSFKRKAEFDDCKVLKQTQSALLVLVDGLEVWIPQSQIDDDSEVYDDKGGSEGKLVISEWIAKERRLV